jgi:hypothetical protein
MLQIRNLNNQSITNIKFKGYMDTFCQKKQMIVLLKEEKKVNF